MCYFPQGSSGLHEAATFQVDELTQNCLTKLSTSDIWWLLMQSIDFHTFLNYSTCGFRYLDDSLKGMYEWIIYIYIYSLEQ